MSALVCPNCHAALTLAAVPAGAGAPAPRPVAPATGDLSTCPVHRGPWQFKSGVSKKNGRAYAFWGCDAKDANGYCNAKPSPSWTPPAPPAAAPAEPSGLDDLPW